MDLSVLYDEIKNPEEGDEFTQTSELGIEKHYVFSNGEWGEVYEDPGWEYVYDDEGSCVHCPFCGSELRYNNGQGCCPDCDSTFTDEDLTRETGGEWHTS